MLAKIKTGQGENLNIPSNKNNVSYEAKDLLVNLLQMDPDRRINWDKFFNHPVFDKHTLKNDMHMKNSIAVNKHFDQAKQETHQNQILKDPLELDNMDANAEQISGTTEYSNSGNEVNPFVAPNRSNSNNNPYANPFNPSNMEFDQSPQIHPPEMHIPQSSFDEIFRRNNFRYFHEKNKILMIYLSVKKFRELMKDPLFSGLVRPIYLLMLILAKKGTALSGMTVYSLESRNNIFKLGNFQEYCNNSQEYIETLNVLKQDQPSIFKYQTYIMTLWDKVPLRVEDNEIRKYLEPSFSDLVQLDKIAKDKYQEIKNGSLPYAVHSDPALKHKYYLTMVFAVYSIKSEQYIPYMKDGIKFQWDNFKEKHEAFTGDELAQLLFNLNI